jgi:multidrug resistance efflux pump
MIPFYQAQLGQAKAQVEQSQANIANLDAQPQAGQRLAETNMEYTVIEAPVDGRVTKLSGTKGTYWQCC